MGDLRHGPVRMDIYSQIEPSLKQCSVSKIEHGVKYHQLVSVSKLTFIVSYDLESTLIMPSSFQKWNALAKVHSTLNPSTLTMASVCQSCSGVTEVMSFLVGKLR